ncbi:hypothetical protein [Sphingomonas sp. LHG3443-2]
MNFAARCVRDHLSRSTDLPQMGDELNAMRFAALTALRFPHG